MAGTVGLALLSEQQSHQTRRRARREKKEDEAKLAEEKRKEQESMPFGGTKAGRRIAAEKSIIARRAGSYAKSAGKGGLG